MSFAWVAFNLRWLMKCKILILPIVGIIRILISLNFKDLNWSLCCVDLLKGELILRVRVDGRHRFRLTHYPLIYWSLGSKIYLRRWKDGLGNPKICLRYLMLVWDKRHRIDEDLRLVVCLHRQLRNLLMWSLESALHIFAILDGFLPIYYLAVHII